MRPNLSKSFTPREIYSAIIQSFGLLPIDRVAIKHIIIAVFEVFGISSPSSWENSIFLFPATILLGNNQWLS